MLQSGKLQWSCKKVDAEWINEHKLNSTHSCHRSDGKIMRCSNCYWRNNKKSTYFIYGKVDASVWKNAKCIWYEATIEPTDAVMQPDVFSAVKCTGILASIAQNQSSFQHLHCTQLTFTRLSLPVSTLIWEVQYKCSYHVLDNINLTFNISLCLLYACTLWHWIAYNVLMCP